MACGLHTNLNAAVASAKKALTIALDNDLPEADLDDILAAYTNLKCVARRVPHSNDEPDTVVTVPDGCIDLDYDPDYNISLGSVDIPDAISWNNDVVTDPVTFTTGDSITFVNDGTLTSEGRPGTPIVTFGEESKEV